MGSETVVLDLMQACINGVRAAGATSQYVFVEGTSYSGAWTWFVSLPVEKSKTDQRTGSQQATRPSAPSRTLKTRSSTKCTNTSIPTAQAHQQPASTLPSAAHGWKPLPLGSNPLGRKAF